MSPESLRKRKDEKGDGVCHATKTTSLKMANGLGGYNTFFYKALNFSINRIIMG